MTADGRRARRLTATVTDLEVARQKALLVGVELDGTGSGGVGSSMGELRLLTDTAGSTPVETVVLKRRSPHPATFVGSGTGGGVGSGRHPARCGRGRVRQ